MLRSVPTPHPNDIYLFEATKDFLLGLCLLKFELKGSYVEVMIVGCRSMNGNK